MTKATNAEMESRIAEIVELILNGHSRSEILEHCRKNWGVGRASADEYTARARAEILEINKDTVQDSLAVIVRNYWKQYRKADAKNDVYAATTVLKEIARVKGLDQQTIVIEDKRDHADLSDEELERRIAEERIQ